MPNMTDYAATYRTFRSQVPERFDFVTDVIERWAADRSKLAMLWVGRDGEERRLTFAWFADRAARFGNALSGAGLEPGDTVFAMLAARPRVVGGLVGLREGRLRLLAGNHPPDCEGPRLPTRGLPGARGRDRRRDGRHGRRGPGTARHAGRRSSDLADLHRPRTPDRMAGIRRARGRGIGHLCRPASPCRRSLAPLLHLRHDRPAKDGPPHPVELCHRAPGDRPLLA